MSELKHITLTTSQQRVLDKMVAFLDGNDKVFVLKGYAGTGKTTLMRFLIEHLRQKERGFHLLASTGRASTILNKATGSVNAKTIHSMIYKYQDFNQDLSQVSETNREVSGQLFLVFQAVKVDEEDANQVYIVDEASMISDTESRLVVQASFGTGRLLKELLEYDSGPSSKFVFVGDPCQLPPIDQVQSPALSVEYIRKEFGIGAQEASLTEVVRQGCGNSIISTSQRVRQLYANAPDNALVYRSMVWGRLPIATSTNISLHPNTADLLDDYVATLKERGYDYATYICRGNLTCYETSMEIRSRLNLWGTIAVGDLLLVVQNNGLLGLYNGDLVEVEAVSAETTEKANLVFRQVKVRNLGSGVSQTTLLIQDILHSGKINLDSNQQKGLFLDFVITMKKQGITQKGNKMQFDRAMQTDPYLNALRCTFGYAITCHKAQGGEWPEVFVCMPRNIMLNPVKSSYQWVYTAMTRAKERLHIVNDIYLESYRRKW